MDNICYNGEFSEINKFSLSIQNRGFKYGDAFFETIKCYKGKPLFFEEHYFRIAASFCIMKMNIPSVFNIEFFTDLIKNLLIKNQLNTSSARVRISFFRDHGGYYLPQSHDVHFIIETEKINKSKYILDKQGLHVGIYTEHILPKTMLGNLKTNNKALNVIASIYAKENNYDDCLLINQDKNIVESLSGNIFIVKDDIIQTPSLEEGCVNGVLRKIILTKTNFKIQESRISLLDIFNASEVFVTNVISGVQWISTVDTHVYSNTFSKELIKFLNQNYLI